MSRSARAHPHKVVACREYDVLVPFVCHRCGACCRKYDPAIDFEMLPEIAHCLGEPIAVIQDRLGDNSRSHRAGHPTDCCFLDPVHLHCLIHGIRPTGCRQFPALEGAGPGDIDCPGHREFRSVLGAFTATREQASRGNAAASRRPRQIPPDARETVLHHVTKAGASDRYREIFQAINAMPDSGREHLHHR
jgi:Fe-S-cluster containining protein